VGDRTDNDKGKCTAEHCLARELCDRYMRPAGDRQVWIAIPLEEHVRGVDCSEFVPYKMNPRP